MSDAGPWLGLAWLGVALVAAAKAHGRQVRLERELRGFDRVDFGGANPPFVEALWARDRRAFWGTFAALLALALLAWLAGARVPLPLGGPDALAGALAQLAWPFVAAFHVAGLASLARFGRDAPALGAREQRGAWLRGAVRGSAVWWALALGAAGAWWALALA